MNCDGGSTNTYTYTGKDYLTGQPLDHATDYISIDSTTGDINVENKPDGTYFIKVIGTLPDLKTSTFYVFTLLVDDDIIGIPNFAPYFVTIL